MVFKPPMVVTTISKGETLGKGFARYPLQRQARISSPFNPNRRHPVTGRVRPHKGWTLLFHQARQLLRQQKVW